MIVDLDNMESVSSEVGFRFGLRCGAVGLEFDTIPGAVAAVANALSSLCFDLFLLRLPDALPLCMLRTLGGAGFCSLHI